MKIKLLPVKLIFFILLVSTFLVINIFIFGNNNYLNAQSSTGGHSGNSSGSTVDVYLIQPETGQYIPTIYGQSEFIISLLGIDGLQTANEITGFSLEVFDSLNGLSLGDLKVLDFWQEANQNWYWHIVADTMSFDNKQYYIRIHAYTTNGEYNLVNQQFGGEPIFGPVSFLNTAIINNPSIDNPYSGIIPFSTRLEGLVNQVNFRIVSGINLTEIGNVVINSPDNSSGYGISSYWRGEWDSTQFSNGQYTAILSYQTLDGTMKRDVISSDFYINSQDNAIAPPCISSWSCDPWPLDCPSTGLMTRTCTATNCVATGETMTEQQACTYVPSTNNVNINTSTNTNTSTNVNINITNTPTNTNTATSPLPPADIPTITMSYPSQGDTVSGAVILKVQVSGNIDQLSFLYRAREGGIENHIGLANISISNDSIWQRAWNTDDVPSGEYYIYARAVINETYNYLSNFIPISIDHSADNIITPDTTQNIPADIVNDDGDIFSNEDEALLNLNPNVVNIINNNEDVELIINDKVALGTISENQGEILKQKYTKKIFDQPTKSGELNQNKLQVFNIDNISPRIGENNLVISGLGPPNTYVTLFIYSDPIVVTTKTDNDGNFTYTLDKNLLDGEHEVYVTVTDDTGQIQEKSSPLTFFVSRAQAVTEEEYLRGDVNIDTERSEVVNNFVLPALIMVGVLIMVVAGVFVANRKKPI